MDALLTFAYIMVGIALGVGTDWLYWRRKFRLAGEQANARSEDLRREWDDKLQNAEFRTAEKETALAAGREQIATLEADLTAARGRHRELEEQLAAEAEKRAAVEAVNGRIPELEAAIAKLTAEKEEREERLAALEQEIEEEKRSLQECLIFVEGSHYLPGKVVRNLTGHKIS